ncbi:hypothetical protein [Herbaspirillum sp.]|uniref:hypothetical protein n=1 Tax=Herbaspirillum sp. TaxID=1890675 RepID=UPI0031D9500A
MEGSVPPAPMTRCRMLALADEQMLARQAKPNPSVQVSSPHHLIYLAVFSLVKPLKKRELPYSENYISHEMKIIDFMFF